jgi:hypothetical protein
MNRDLVNVKILDLLARFGSVDREALLAEASRVDDRAILRSGVLVNKAGVVDIHLIGVMEALLMMAFDKKPPITVPRDRKYLRDALILFLKLNYTERFCLRSDDEPSNWAFRILDFLFTSFTENKTLSLRDQLVLLRVGENPLWQAAFTYALQLYVEASRGGPKFIKGADQPALNAAGKSFKAAIDTRRARIPTVKYGNPLASARELTEYAIGQYLDGLDVNEALAQTLVQSQLGTQGEEGRRRFEDFLKSNALTNDKFPTTTQELYDLVGRQIRFQETEEEVSNALYAYAKASGQQKNIERMFAGFVELSFPIAAKLNRVLSFSGLDSKEVGALIARWMRESRCLDPIRNLDPRKRVEAVIEQVTQEDLQLLNAFRSGRTLVDKIGEGELSAYVDGRVKLLQMNAVNQKMRRIEQAIMQQMDAAEVFVVRPGKEIPKDMTYGIEEFFRVLRAVFRDVFESADQARNMQVRKLNEFNKKYGPLSLVSVLVPRDPALPLKDWIAQAQKHLNEVPYYVFEGAEVTR